MHEIRFKVKFFHNDLMPGAAGHGDKQTKLLRNSYNPARWYNQIKRTVPFDVTLCNVQFSRIQRS